MSILTRPEPQGPHSKSDYENRTWSAQSVRLMNEFVCGTCGATGREAIGGIAVLADAILCKACNSWTNVGPLRRARARPTDTGGR